MEDKEVERINKNQWRKDMEHLIGKEIEAFQVQAYHEGKFIEVTETDLKGHWSIFFFYPGDFTFVCPTELGDLADFYSEFKKNECEIYSISTDSQYVHKAWADKSDTIKKITYPMISDSAWTLSRQLGVLVENGQALRGTFIIDPQGKIQAYEIHNMGIGRNAEELLRKLQSARFVAQHGDEVCPAKWKPGEKTIKPSLDLIGML